MKPNTIILVTLNLDSINRDKLYENSNLIFDILKWQIKFA